MTFEENLHGQINLDGARVFKESGRNTSARWYITPDGKTYHSRCKGHLIVSIHSPNYLECSSLVEEN